MKPFYGLPSFHSIILPRVRSMDIHAHPAVIYLYDFCINPCDLHADRRNNTWSVSIGNGDQRPCPIGLIEHWICSLVVSGHPGNRRRGLNFPMTCSAKAPRGVNRDDLQSSTSPHLSIWLFTSTWAAWAACSTLMRPLMKARPVRKDFVV